MVFEAEIPEIDEPLNRFRDDAGDHFEALKNHIYRMYHFTIALAEDKDAAHLPTAIAGVYHDIGVFTTGGMDYIEPSVDLARDYLDTQHRTDLLPLITEIIRNHHKLTPYRGKQGELVEAFRRADLADLSMGFVKAGVPGEIVRGAYKAYPTCGFHAYIYGRVMLWAIRNPLRPLPMMKG